MFTSSLRCSAKSGVSRAFTLVELLVVVAIIALLAAILFPVFSRARERALVSSDSANLRQIGQAVLLYAHDYDGRMPFETKLNWGTPGIQSYKPLAANAQSNAFVPTDHQGPYETEDTLQPYVKNMQIFASPADTGDGLNSTPFHERYGRSYKMEGRVLSKRKEKKTVPAWQPMIRTLAGLENGIDEKKMLEAQFETDPVKKAELVAKANSGLSASQLQLAREEFASWDVIDSKTGKPKVEELKDDMDNKTGEKWQRKAWFSLGANVVFLDGHVKYIVNKAQWDWIRGNSGDD